MARMRSWPTFLAILLMVLAATNCGTPAGEDRPEAAPTAAASETPAAPDTDPDRCGNGTCDEQEGQDPDLCAEDCLTPVVEPLPGPEEGGTPPLCQTEPWWLVITGCVDYTGNAEPATHLCSTIQACITAPIDEGCQIEGMGFGQYDPATCVYTSPSDGCTYQVECPDFTCTVSGDRAGDKLRIKVLPIDMREQVTATCAGQTASSSSGLGQSGIGSAMRNGAGFFCEIEARDRAKVRVSGVDAVEPDKISYDYQVAIYAGCP